MKTITIYQCEFCKTEYLDKEECKQCENNHKKNLKIVETKYVPFISDESGYPARIEVGFDNGKVLTYYRH